MSLMKFNFESDYLKSNFEVSIIMPDRPRALTPREFYGRGIKYKVIWLLHGTFGDHTDWSRKSNIEVYACEKDLIVVMPSALNSNYSNWDRSMMGFGMFDYITEELMPMVYNWLPASDARADNFVAGLSMGGRGALKYAVNHPDKFAAAAILSACPEDLSGMTDESAAIADAPFASRMRNTLENAGGVSAYVNSDENAWAIIDQSVSSGRALPKLLFACGTKDERVMRNLAKFRPHAEKIKLDAEFWTLEGFGHEWRFWDLAIQHVFEFFGI